MLASKSFHILHGTATCIPHIQFPAHYPALLSCIDNTFPYPCPAKLDHHLRPSRVRLKIRYMEEIRFRARPKTVYATTYRYYLNTFRQFTGNFALKFSPVERQNHWEAKEIQCSHGRVFENPILQPCCDNNQQLWCSVSDGWL